MSLAVRQVDSELAAAAARYPKGLPPTHMAHLRGWTCGLRHIDGLLAACTRDEFAALPALVRGLEANRCWSEAELALAKAGEALLGVEAKESETQRALGILPGDEAGRFGEIASCHDFSPHYLTSSPERFQRGIAEVETEFGQATALGYGYVLMAGVRSFEDLAKYGNRIQQLFEAVTGKGGAAQVLSQTSKSRMANIGHDVRAKLLRAVRDGLWQMSSSRVGRPFLLTQVVDGYLGLRPGGVGDDLGLAVVDAIMVSKLALPVNFLQIKDGIYLEIGVSAHGFEYWDPLERHGEVRLAAARRLSTMDVMALGYTRMARGYANIKSFQHGARVAQWVLGLQPAWAEAYQILGQCLLGEQKPREAIAMCEKALEHDRRLADAYLVAGNAHSMMGHWPEAVEQYKLAIHNRVGYAEAYNNLGLALARNGEPERAIGAYKEAVRVRPDYAEAYYNHGNLHFELAQMLAEDVAKNVEFDLAIEAYRKAVGQAPDFAGAHYNLGQAYYGKHDLPGALAAYQAAVKANPKHAGAWHNMGIVYRDMGRQDLAVEALEKAVTLNPILLR